MFENKCYNIKKCTYVHKFPIQLQSQDFEKAIGQLSSYIL